MKANLVGLRRVDMNNERGEPVRGYSLFLTYPSNGVQGLEASKRFVSDAFMNDCGWYPTVGKEINVEFGPRGGLVAIADVPANAK